MDRRTFLATVGGAGLAAAAPQQQRPNIVILLADDLGYSDVGPFGGEIRTPNLDSLAREGVRFTHFYNTARCCPSRATLLTGLYAHQAGVGHMVNPKPFPAYAGDLNHNCVTLAEALKPAGYETYMSGKWHVTPFNEDKHNWPLQRGFDKYFGIIAGAGDYFDPHSLVRGNDRIERGSSDFYLTDAIGTTRSNTSTRPRARSFSTPPSPRRIGRCTRSSPISRATRAATKTAGTRSARSAARA